MYTDARRAEIRSHLEAMLKETENVSGLHPKTDRIYKRIFDDIDNVGGDTERYRGRRKRQRTWKDHNQNTMYLS